ncbi:YceI family protein [Membranihabitans maritimus]|uniref:YceI family protein n=1 Tax=Membranihabitans maritimus TaxID=2904244 RepID=UPI001F34152C|nr:YceI family protein [Membranihabitans maritimus]
MYRAALICICLLFSIIGFSQERYITKQGYISFYSHTPVEDIKAENNQVLSIVDLSTGNVAVTLLMKSFEFEKALMQEHFNENYVESDKYPKASFEGEIQNLKEILDGENGVAAITGDLTVHGITKPITMEGKLKITDDAVNFDGSFMVTVADYEINIPSVVARNIAKEVEVTCKLEHTPYR